MGWQIQYFDEQAQQLIDLAASIDQVYEELNGERDGLERLLVCRKAFIFD